MEDEFVFSKYNKSEEGPLELRKKTKKTKVQKVYEAFDALQKALKEDEPHIRIIIEGGIDKDSEQGKALVKSLKAFIAEYKKYYGLKIIEVEFVL